MLYNLVKEFKDAFEETLVSSVTKMKILYEFTNKIENIFDEINMNLYLSQKELERESELFNKLKNIFIKCWTYYNFFWSGSELGIYIYPFKFYLSGSYEIKSLTVNTEQKVILTDNTNAVLVNIKNNFTNVLLHKFISYVLNDSIKLDTILDKISTLNLKSNNFMLAYQNPLNTNVEVLGKNEGPTWRLLGKTLNKISLGEKENGKYRPLDIYLTYLNLPTENIDH
jgi:hypothetical protein